MKKDRDLKALNQQYNKLEQQEEVLDVRLEPLQGATFTLVQVIEDKKKELTTLLEEMKPKLEETMSSQLVEEVKDRNGQLQLAVAECNDRYEDLYKTVQDGKHQVEWLGTSHMWVLGAFWRQDLRRVKLRWRLSSDHDEDPKEARPRSFVNKVFGVCKREKPLVFGNMVLDHGFCIKIWIVTILTLYK